MPRELPEGAIPVLDKGFIRLVDYMGNDFSIVQAARVSYGKGTTKKSRDEALIRYLLRHRHTTPFEMVDLKWHAKMPIFVARQWVRHRTASINEYSMRYSEPIADFYIPDSEQIKKQGKTNKQGRDDKVSYEVGEEFKQRFKENMEKAFETNDWAMQNEIARELSRINLPVGMYTEWYWKNDLHNTFHFLKLRMDKHAQWEIRQYANAMATKVKEVVPIAYQAFEDYILNGITLSKLEQQAIGKIISGKNKDEITEKLFENKFERNEFLDKLKRFNP